MTIAHPVEEAAVPHADFADDAYRLYEVIRDGGPVQRIPDTNVYLVVDYANVIAVCQNWKSFSNVRELPRAHAEALAKIGVRSIPDSRALQNNDPPEHTEFREVLAGILSASSIKRFRPNVVSLAESLIEPFGDRRRAELVSEFCIPFPLSVILELVGLDRTYRDDVYRWSQSWSTLLSLSSGEEALSELEEPIVEMRLFLRDALRSRKANPRNDVLSAIANARLKSGRHLTESEQVSFLTQTLSAGHETSRNALGNLFALVAQDSELQAELRTHPDRTSTVVDESLRVWTPSPWMARYVRENTVVDGVAIPKGSVLLVMFACANRDGRRFEHPDVVDVTRNPNRHIAFGNGIHHCQGAQLAKIELQVALEVVLSRFQNMRLVREESDLGRTSNPRFYGPRKLVVELD